MAFHTSHDTSLHGTCRKSTFVCCAGFSFAFIHISNQISADMISLVRWQKLQAETTCACCVSMFYLPQVACSWRCQTPQSPLPTWILGRVLWCTTTPWELQCMTIPLASCQHSPVLLLAPVPAQDPHPCFFLGGPLS